MIERATVTAPEMIGLLVWWIVVLAAPVILAQRRAVQGRDPAVPIARVRRDDRRLRAHARSDAQAEVARDPGADQRRRRRVALTAPVIDDDAAWLKHQLALAKQTLPDGECRLPMQQRSPHPNACHSCPHFLTASATGLCSSNSSSTPSSASLTRSAPGRNSWRRSTAPTCWISAGSSPALTASATMSRPQPEALAAYQRQRSAQRRDAVTARSASWTAPTSRSRWPPSPRWRAWIAATSTTTPTCLRRSVGSATRHQSARTAAGRGAFDDRLRAGPAGQRTRRDRATEGREPHAARAPCDRARRCLAG